MEDFRVYKNRGSSPNLMTDRVAWETLRKLFSSYSVNPELKRQFTHIELEGLMKEYHARMTAETFTPPYSMGGFHIDFIMHRLGATKGRASLLLHPEDYKRVLNIEDEPI